ncbi:MAG: DUF2520 domain-containing protein [Deltaproteobacteria bacterium]
MTLFLLGWGRMGSAIALQARAAGWRILGVQSRSAASVQRARRSKLPASRALPRAISADLILLAVPDGAIADAAAALAERRLSPQAVVAHLSGVRGQEPLAPLAGRGLALGSLHPYASSAGPGSRLTGAACAIDGDPRAKRLLRRLARDLGLRPLTRAPRDRARYHLSAVLVASSAGALAGWAERLLRESGASAGEAERAVAGLLASVAENLRAHGARAALTGPFARGDPDTVARHLALLSKEPRGRTLYASLGRLALELAQEAGLGNPRGRAAISRMLPRP